MLREAAEAEWENCPGDASINRAGKAPALRDGEEELYDASDPQLSWQSHAGWAAQQTCTTSAEMHTAQNADVMHTLPKTSSV